MNDVVINYGPKYKAVIERVEGCHHCVTVDDILVPHCDCSRHEGLNGATD